MESKLTDLYQEVLVSLQEGVQHGRHPFHLMSVACVNASQQPELRTVVLRKHDAEARIIAFHTDIRSPKITWMKANPEVALLLYNAESKTQCRLNGMARIHYQDEIADMHWQKTNASSRICYLAEHGSGAEVASSVECGVNSAAREVQCDADEQKAWQNFAVVSIRYKCLDVVKLKATGHVRAIFSWGDTQQMQAKWVAI